MSFSEELLWFIIRHRILSVTNLVAALYGMRLVLSTSLCILQKSMKLECKQPLVLLIHYYGVPWGEMMLCTCPLRWYHTRDPGICYSFQQSPSYTPISVALLFFHPLGNERQYYSPFLVIWWTHQKKRLMSVGGWSEVSAADLATCYISNTREKIRDSRHLDQIGRIG